MRFLLTLCIAVLLLGGVGLCQFGLTRTVQVQFVRDAHSDHDGDGDDHAGDRFTIVLTPSFSAVADPFAVVTRDDSAPHRITIRSGEEDLLTWDGDVTPGVALRRDDVVVNGTQVEWFVEATPALPDAARPCALRIQVFQGDVLYGDHTVWSDGDGASIADRVALDLAPVRSSLDRGLVEAPR